MAVKKFSQITTSGVNMTAADFMMAVQNGTTDVLFTTAQVTAGLNVFTNALQGLVPASGGGTANFMRADGSWAIPPGTVAPGGAVNTIQFNSAGGFGGMSGTAWDDTNRSLVLTGATITANHPIFDLAQTWNNGAIAFTGIKFNVTNSASAAGSLLLDLQVGGSSKFNVGSGTFPNITIADFATILGNGLIFNTDGNANIQIGNAHGLSLSSVIQLAWTQSASATDVRDTGISRGVAANIAFGNGTAGDSSATFVAKTKAGAPAAGDIPAGSWQLIRDTSGATTKIYYNNGGVLMSVALA